MTVDEINERRRKDGGNQEIPWVRKEEGPWFFLWVFILGSRTLSACRLLHGVSVWGRDKGPL